MAQAPEKLRPGPDRMTIRVGVLHGPNLNRLGEREPDRYGLATLAEVDSRLSETGSRLHAETVSFQSNHEGELIDWIQTGSPDIDGWLVNAAGLTHTSVALRDALVASRRPFVEVHLTNVYAREPFRHRSLLADAAVGVIAGFGLRSYVWGLEALVEYLQSRS